MLIETNVVCHTKLFVSESIPRMWHCIQVLYPNFNYIWYYLNLLYYFGVFFGLSEILSCTLDRIRTCGLRIRNPLLNSCFVVKKVAAVFQMVPNYGTEFCIGLTPFESVWLFDYYLCLLTKGSNLKSNLPKSLHQEYLTCHLHSHHK